MSMTPRAIAILRVLSSGPATAKELADALGCHVDTVRNHVGPLHRYTRGPARRALVDRAKGRRGWTYSLTYAGAAALREEGGA